MLNSGKSTLTASPFISQIDAANGLKISTTTNWSDTVNHDPYESYIETHNLKVNNVLQARGFMIYWDNIENSLDTLLLFTSNAYSYDLLPQPDTNAAAAVIRAMTLILLVHFTPLKVSSIKRFDQKLSRSKVSCKRYIMCIAKSDYIVYIRLTFL